MKYAKEISGCHQKKNQKKITSIQPRKLIFGIQPYLTQLDEILKTTPIAVKKIKIGVP
jgi:hypothetical protein